MNRRKGVPCGCDADPCGCSPKNHCVKAINNVSPDPNGDFTINAGTGIGIIQTGDDEITIVNTSDPDTFVEGKNIEFTPVGDDLEIGVVDDPVIDGTLTVNGDIIQNGAAYETHAEKVYTTNDYIVMRDGAVGGLAIGDYAGFQVEKYDGTNDGRLVIDRDGVARVGDVGDEQPLMTRDESADMTDGALIKWDAANSKAINEGTVGSDTKPVKIVNGVATEVTDALQKKVLKWIEIHDYTLPSNMTTTTVSFDMTLDHTITDINKTSWSYLLCSVTAYSTLAFLTWQASTSNTITVTIYKETTNTIQAGARWRLTIYELE